MNTEFNLLYGKPDIDELMSNYKKKLDAGNLSKLESVKLKKIVKCFNLLKSNPRHPGLNTHEISDLTKKYKVKVFQSYLENHTPGSGRVYWVFGPKKGDITVVGIENHPKPNTYRYINLSMK